MPKKISSSPARLIGFSPQMRACEEFRDSDVLKSVGFLIGNVVHSDRHLRNTAVSLPVTLKSQSHTSGMEVGSVRHMDGSTARHSKLFKLWLRRPDNSAVPCKNLLPAVS